MDTSEYAESQHSHNDSRESQTTSQDDASVGRVQQLEEDARVAGKHFSNDYQRRLFLFYIILDHTLTYILCMGYGWKTETVVSRHAINKLGGMDVLTVRRDEIVEIDKEDPITAGARTPVYKTQTQTTRLGRVQLLAVLLTLSDKLIERLILGQVFCHYRTPALRDLYLRIPTEGRSTARPKDTDLKPAIYGNFLCDHNGRHLSYNQFSRLLDLLERYAEGLEEDESGLPVRPTQPREIAKWAREVDERITTGRPRKYQFQDTEKGQRRYIRTAAHRDQLKEWIATKRDHLSKWLADNTAENGALPDCDQPLPWTVLDIGWTNYQPKRRNDHESHSGSIWHMNLVDSMARTQIGRHFQIRFLALYAVPAITLVPMAEHVLTRLAGGYATSGGFNWTVAGKSISGRNDILERTWNEERRIAEEKYIPRYDELYDASQERRDFVAYSYSIQAKKEEADKLDLESAQLDEELHQRRDELDTVDQHLDQSVGKYLDFNKAGQVTGLVKECQYLEELQRDLEQLSVLTKDMYKTEDARGGQA